MTKQAAIYNRFSPRPDADTSKSNLQQRNRCQDYCNRKDYNVQVIFSDESISGSTLFRPGLNRIMDALHPGMVLVVDTPDRLARDLLVDLTIRKQIADLGCTLEFADGSPNTETPEGELIHDIMAAFASYERKKFARRTKAGMAKKKSEGVWCGRPPIGWRKVKLNDKLVEDPNEQNAIAQMRRLAVSYTAQQIADIFNNPSPDSDYGLCRGRPWSARTIRRILSKTRP